MPVVRHRRARVLCIWGVVFCLVYMPGCIPTEQPAECLRVLPCKYFQGECVHVYVCECVCVCVCVCVCLFQKDNAVRKAQKTNFYSNLQSSRTHKGTAGNGQCSSCGTGALGVLASAADFPSGCRCQAGYTLSAAETACVACPAGAFKGAAGNEACTPCGSNAALQTATGQTFAQACFCQAGFQLNGTATGCNACPPNSYKGGVDNTNCIACGPGAVGTAATASTFGAGCACTNGFQPDSLTQPTLCTACPANTFKDQQSNTMCTACPASSVAPPGQTSQDACQCIAGYGGNAAVSSALAESCVICDYGSYKGSVGNANCSACPQGYTTLQRASTALADCSERCGNSQIRGGEACDDGNTASGDGCSSSCQRETGWSCPAPGVACINCGVSQQPSQLQLSCTDMGTPLQLWLQSHGGAVATNSAQCGTGKFVCGCCVLTF